MPATSIRRLLDYLAYLAVRGVVCAVQALSLAQCQRLAGFLAVVMADVVGLRGEVVEENLRFAFPDWTEGQRRQVARDMWRHLFLMVAEIAHARRKLHPSNWRRYIKFHRDDEMVRALLADRPVVLVSGHFGNFELASYLLGVFGFSTYAVARPLDNPYVDRYLNSFREAMGQYILPKDDVAGAIADLLAHNQALAVLGDTHASGKQGCWVDFFGRPAATHKAIALFALGSDAPLLVSFARRLGEPLVFEVGLNGVFDPREPGGVSPTVPEVTSWHASRLEALIRTAPEQYWWLHRRWKGNPKPKLKRKRNAA